MTIRRASSGLAIAIALAVAALLHAPPPATAQSEPGSAGATEGTPDEGATGLGEPEPGVRRTRTRRSAERAAPERAPWDGPRVELGYSHFALPDGYGGGAVHAGVFGGYLSTSPVRLGAWAELGVREYALSSDDFLARAALIAGYQHLGFRPFLPYIGVVGTVGVAVGERYHTPGSWVFGGAGLEGGADLNLVNNLWIGVGLSYLRVSMQDNGFDLFILRLRVGL